MKHIIIFLLTFLSINACGQKQMKTPKNAMDKFETFKKKEKFVEDSTIHYPGITDEKMRPTFTEKINKVADGFKKIAQEKNPTEKEYQNEIKVGLESFADIYLELDTEDRERVCSYFEELMDIIGLESSNGQLNNFMYGFDPTKIKNE